MSWPLRINRDIHGGTGDTPRIISVEAEGPRLQISKSVQTANFPTSPMDTDRPKNGMRGTFYLSNLINRKINRMSPKVPLIFSNAITGCFFDGCHKLSSFFIVCPSAIHSRPRRTQSSTETIVDSGKESI